MMIEAGDLVEIKAKKYICVGVEEVKNGYNYLLLMSTFKPLKLEVARDCGNDCVEIINYHEERRRIFEMISERVKNNKREEGDSNGQNC